jgi:hypothetical protein
MVCDGQSESHYTMFAGASKLISLKDTKIQDRCPLKTSYFCSQSIFYGWRCGCPSFTPHSGTESWRYRWKVTISLVGAHSHPRIPQHSRWWATSRRNLRSNKVSSSSSIITMLSARYVSTVPHPFNSMQWQWPCWIPRYKFRMSCCLQSNGVGVMRWAWNSRCPVTRGYQRGFLSGVLVTAY